MTRKHQVIEAHRLHPEWSAKQIAAYLDCSAAYVRTTAVRNDIVLPRHRRRKIDDLIEAREARERDAERLAAVAGEPKADPRALDNVRQRATQLAERIEAYWRDRGRTVHAKAVRTIGPMGGLHGYVTLSTLVGGLPGPLKELPDEIQVDDENELDQRRRRHRSAA